MLIVHHLNNSRSQRVLWMLEELGVPYEIQKHQRNPKTMLAPPSLKAVHPLGKSPVVTDGANTLAESGAILEYLVDTYGAGKFVPPAGTPEFLRYRYFMHYAEGSAMPPLVMKLVFMQMAKRAPFIVKPIVKGISETVQRDFIDPQIETHTKYWEEALTAHEWFAGNEFTAADVQMSFPLEAASSRSNIERFPRVKGFVERIHARPAYQRALERGGPYAYA